MGLHKGQTNNPKGKPKGARSKKTKEWESLAESITGEQSKNFSKFMNELWNSDEKKDKVMASELYLKTLEYFKPKQSRVESHMEIEGEPITFILPK